LNIAKEGGYFNFLSSETVSLCLPFALRLANTLRPLAVSILLRKPCTLLRRRLCGWNVLFILKKFYLIQIISTKTGYSHHTVPCERTAKVKDSNHFSAMKV
jgi:hypothetical protein